MNSHLTRSLFLMALAHLTIELCGNFLPVVYPLLINNMGLTYTQVGIVALALGICGSLAQPLFGYLSDRWGSRWITALSIAWIGLLMGLVGFAWNYPSVVLLVGLGGLGSAAFHPAAAALALASGGKRRGAAISVFSVGGNLGAALSPLLVTAGLGWLGLQGTSVIFPVALLVSLFVYQQLGHIGRAKNARPVTSRQQSRPDNPEPVETGILVGLGLIILAIMGRSWFQVTLITYLPEWLQGQGRSLATGGQMLSVFLVAIGVGSLSGGALSDYVGRWQVLVLSLALLGPAQWVFLSVSGLWQAAVLAVMGVLVGSTFPVGLVMAQEAWPQRVGLASALVMGLGWAPGGLGASITGYLADRFSLTVGLQSLILPPLVGVGCILVYVALQRRRVRAEWAVTEMVEK